MAFAAIALEATDDADYTLTIENADVHVRSKTTDCAYLAERSVVPASRRHLEKIPPLSTAHPHDFGGIDP